MQVLQCVKLPGHMDLGPLWDGEAQRWDNKNAVSNTDKPSCWISSHGSGSSFGIAQVRCRWHHSPNSAQSCWVFWQAAQIASSRGERLCAGRQSLPVTVMVAGESGFCCLDMAMKRGNLLRVRLPTAGCLPLFKCPCVAEQYWALLCCKCRHSAAAGGKSDYVLY